MFMIFGSVNELTSSNVVCLRATLQFKNFKICSRLVLCPQQSGLKCGHPWKLRVGLFQVLPIMFAFGGWDVRDDLVRLLGHACAVMLPMRVVII